MTTSLEVRDRLVEALQLDLVGPNALHAFAIERLPGWIRPSVWYLTGFLIPSSTPPNKNADDDEEDDFELVPESAGLAEESTEDRKAAKKGYFPSSIGLSFLVSKHARDLAITVRWGDYSITEIADGEGKPFNVWQRIPRESTVALALTGAREPTTCDIPDSSGLQLHVVERAVTADELATRIPAGTCSVSVFLVNYRSPSADRPDTAY